MANLLTFFLTNLWQGGLHISAMVLGTHQQRKKVITLDNEKIISGLDSKDLKDKGVNAIEALFAQLKSKDKYIQELESIISSKNKFAEYCSPAGISTAKQVEAFTGLKPSMVRELGYRGVFEEIREGKMVRYKFNSVLAFVQRKPKLKVI